MIIHLSADHQDELKEHVKFEKPRSRQVIFLQRVGDIVFSL